MFSIEMLPARQGDCLWIEYGPADGAPHIVLIDGGMGETAAAIRKKIKNAKKPVRIELIVVTHIDNDHILGIIELLRDPNLGIEIGDIWFNGRPQLDAAVKSNILGTDQGDQLSDLLEIASWDWNARFDGELIFLTDDEEPPVVTLEGGLRLSVIGPPTERLNVLADKWLSIKDGKDDGEKASGDLLGEGTPATDVLGRSDIWPPEWKNKSPKDPSVANGSSIVLVAEYDNKRLLLTGDAFAEDLVAGLRRYREANDLSENAIPFAAIKLSHHGSVNNVSQELLELVDCKRYLVSTDGTQHKHPDTQALLRIVKWSTREPEFCFNYVTERTGWWINRGDELDPQFRSYKTKSPTPDNNGYLTVSL